MFLLTDDDIIISDPEAEYFPLVNRLGGQVIKLSPTSTQYLNPMDINPDYSDEDVYCKGYLNRTQIQYTAKGSSVADSSGFARKRRADESTSTSECHTLLLRIA